MEKARIFAGAAHAAVGQVRKYTGEPYIVHPIEVATMLWSVGMSDEVCAAAMLHDVVEDTKVTIELVRAEFGTRIAELVAMVTDVAKPSDGNRAVRMAINRAHSAAADCEGQSIKLADLISNTKSITQHDKDFARVYLAEKELLLEVLKDGHDGLFKMAQDSLLQGKLSLMEPNGN